MKWTVTVFVMFIVLVITLSDSSTARFLPNRRMAEREVTREANPGNSADDIASKNLQVDEFIAELANLSIPHHLKDLYVNFTYSDGKIGDDTKANTIRSYGNTAKNADCGFYKFEVDKDKVDREQIVRAELHLFQNNSPVASGHHYNVHVYYLLRARDLESPLQLTFRHVPSADGWKTFDITSIAESWKQQGWVNYGLKIKLTGKGNEVLPCDGVFADENEHTTDTEPSLVVYTHDHNSKFFEELLKKEEKTLNHVTPQQKRRKRNIIVDNVSCHRKSLTIHRETLSSNNIALQVPYHFDAGACVGHCGRIEQNEPRSMSYASVVSLHYLRTVGLQAAPTRCCVPISYDTVPVMMFRDTRTQQTILKTNVPVIAKRCGCL